MKYQKLFDHLHEEHKLILLQSEMMEIENIVNEQTTSQQQTIERLREENKVLLYFLDSFMTDFEIDYVMPDGSIVDNPSVLLTVNYNKAKEAKQLLNTTEPIDQ